METLEGAFYLFQLGKFGTILSLREVLTTFQTIFSSRLIFYIKC